MIWIFRIIRALRMDKLLQIRRSTYPFVEYFRGLEDAPAIRRIFGEKTEEVLGNLRVGFTSLGGYMRVDGYNGNLMVNSRYLNNGNKIDIYLDILHELVHMRQFMEGKELFDSDYSYVERPTEVEAYRFAVEEARRLGLDDHRICEYLKTEWMTEKDLNQLAKTLGVKCMH